MFDRLIGQPGVTRLIEELKSSRMPYASMFKGERYTGKLTAALETARVLSCGNTGSALCDCDSCTRQRLTSYPYTLILGNRDFMVEIEAHATGFLKYRNEHYARKLVRSVRILLGRFRSDIFEPTGNVQKASAVSAYETDELIEEFLSNHTEKRTLSADKAIKAIIKKAAALDQSIKSSNIPVQQIRGINTWLLSTPEDSTKCVIIEGVESMGDASQNALLKVLEEPPARSYFILLSGRIGRLLPTITSRVRTYHFADLGPDAVSQILQEEFQTDPESYDSIKTCLMMMGGVDCRQLRSDAEIFLGQAIGRKDYEPILLSSIIERIQKNKTLGSFLEELGDILAQDFHDGLLSDRQAERFIREIDESSRRANEMRQSVGLVMERLLYMMRTGKV